jgi:hypothetical protein
MAQAIEDPTSEMIPRAVAAPEGASVGPPIDTLPANPWPLRIGLGALGLVAIGAMLFVVYLVNQPVKRTAILVHWPLAERKESFLEVSGNPIELAKRDPLVVHVEPGPHRVTIRRKGFEPVVWNFTLTKSEQKNLTPEWHEATK